ncbi:hypothetical protein HELRODRAFT_191887 [Helobdella robusta]|uniref:TFIIS N-terminal domain-containing protein n=1 Tax=Helobdella robusta TaxID=6412 RepID=T1FTE1_HELRO|nr:hypothetical protein HELRODRAFT_191887 [Helobdella robusta]ESO03603.1 hypothetical protein HELRODRAFT_191887 [Helobdella robusta]
MSTNESGDNKESSISIKKMAGVDFQRWQNFPVANQVQLIDNNNLNSYRIITISNNSNPLNFSTDGSNNFFLNGELLINESGFKMKPAGSGDNFCVDDLIDNCLATNVRGETNANSFENNSSVSSSTVCADSAAKVKTIPITDLTSTNGVIDSEMMTTVGILPTIDNTKISTAAKTITIQPQIKTENPDCSSTEDRTTTIIPDKTDTKIKIDVDTNFDNKSASPSYSKSLSSDDNQSSLKEEKNVLGFEFSSDPYQFLENLSSLLDSKGGLKEYSDSFVQILKLCSTMPCQCILINVIKSTESSIIKKLLQRGAWQQLHTWLRDACTQINKPLMLELLQLFKLLPVNTKLLRSNNCAKDIKQLIKNSDERVTRLARVVVDEWMKVVKGPSAESTSSSSGDKLKKKLIALTTPSSSDSTNDDRSKTSDNNITAEKKSNILDRNKINNSTVSKAQNLSKNASSSSNGSGASSSSKASCDSLGKKERPKTVKVKPQNFRMTGLEDLKGSNANGSNNNSTAKSVKNGSNSSSSSSSPANKCTASAVRSSSKDANSNKSKVVQAPKPISPEIFEKSLFMDALQASSTPAQQKRKRRLTPDATKSSSTTTTSISSSSLSAITTASNTATATAPSSSLYSLTSSTTTTVTAALQNDDLTPQAKRPRLSPDVTTEQRQQSSSSSPPPHTSTTTSTSASSSSSSSSLGTKLKKSVTWASETDLCSFHYFEFDADERCNVNNLKKSLLSPASSSSSSVSNSGFQDHWKHELEMERELLFGKNHHSKNKPSEMIDWFCPPLIEFLEPSSMVPGSESEEKLTQARRETLVLQIIYFNRDRIPDSPSEPDEPQLPGDQSQSACKIIPLDDIGEGEEPMDESEPQPADTKQPQDPTNKLILPEAITNLLDSYMNSTNNMNCQSNSPVLNVNNPVSHYDPNVMNQSNHYNQYAGQSNLINNMPAYPMGFNMNGNVPNMERKSYDPGFMYNHEANSSHWPRFDCNPPNFPNQRPPPHQQFDDSRRRFQNREDGRGRGGNKSDDYGDETKLTRKIRKKIRFGHPIA